MDDGHATVLGFYSEHLPVLRFYDINFRGNCNLVHK